jgi:uncharacterized protein DUF3800
MARQQRHGFMAATSMKRARTPLLCTLIIATTERESGHRMDVKSGSQLVERGIGASRRMRRPYPSAPSREHREYTRGWEALIQRFENTLKWRNFPGPWLTKDIGVIFSDAANEAALRRLYRRMRVYNPIPNMRSRFLGGYRQLPLSRIAEDPNIRHSHHSYFIQAADTAAFALYQWHAPSSYVRKKGAKNYFLRLNPVLCKVASKGPYGIVEL